MIYTDGYVNIYKNDTSFCAGTSGKLSWKERCIIRSLSDEQGLGK